MTLSWQIGDVTIRRVAELESTVPYHKYPLIAEARPEALQHMPWLSPHLVTEQRHLLTSVHALVVDAPGLRMLPYGSRGRRR